MRGKFWHASNFGAGPSGTENFDTSSPWVLVDNQLCETLVGPNFEQYQLIREKKRARPGVELTEVWGRALEQGGGGA